MSSRRAIGTIVPSSNRTVERALAALLAEVPDVDSCIARIPYHGDGLGQPADDYDADSFGTAAALLRHAEVEVVCWNGTRGAALGLARDRALCAAIGGAATTTALATDALLARLGARRIGMVVQGPEASAAPAAAGLAGSGAALVAARGLGITDNRLGAAAPAERIAGLVREVAAARPDAILIWSTNLRGWSLMAPLEAELGLPVLDSAAIGVWACLEAIGVRAPARLGRLFALGTQADMRGLGHTSCGPNP